MLIIILIIPSFRRFILSVVRMCACSAIRRAMPSPPPLWPEQNQTSFVWYDLKYIYIYCTVVLVIIVIMRMAKATATDHQIRFGRRTTGTLATPRRAMILYNTAHYTLVLQYLTVVSILAWCASAHHQNTPL